MNQIVDRGWELLQRLLFPQQRKWVAGILIVAGLSMLTTPAWAPYADAILEHFWGIKMPSTAAATGLGVLILVMGVAIHIFNEYLERRPSTPLLEAPQVSPADFADQRSLVELFSNLHVPTFDQFFQLGQESKFYLPMLHYYFGLKDFVQASEYHLHDAQMESEISALHNSLTLAVSFGGYFTDTSNPDLQKFDCRWDVDADSNEKRASETFHYAVTESRDRLRKVCKLIKSRYPDFDFKSTNRAALQDMQEYRRRAEDDDAKTLPHSDFSVMHAILEAEGGPLYPNLQTLVGLLRLPQVDVQVALDRLIEKGFVKHLYPGQLYQKFTVLKPGRAYYVDQRESHAGDKAI
ncbi:hypothetical protein [Pseudomonas proteolytica]|uniref:hypothetical protein n=1 Tax=Pseudomonas proteolytica TaxID=219574 RepID=UPI0030DDC6D2